MNVGRATFDAEDLAVDRELADIAHSFRFLLDVTPVNVGDARERFLRSQTEAPEFEYRSLEDDPGVIAKRLDLVAVETFGDPTLSHLFQDKRRELALQLDMLRARGTGDFLPLSIELFGTVGPALLDRAEALLRNLKPTPAATGPWLDAAAFGRRAQEEIDHYCALDSEVAVHVEIRSDCSGVMVSNGDLLIPSALRIAESRVDGLLHHEIGTHIVTYLNGCRQPLRLLSCGLAGYEETQEGLAVLAEYFVGALTSRRLRQIAARVIAVHQMVAGRTFRDVHSDLVDANFSPAEAFSIVMRVYRSGGLTKDAVYLRGLEDLVTHVGTGRSIDVLWLGKMALSSAPLIEELVQRNLLVRPSILPRYLDVPGVKPRLARLEHASSFADLINVLS